MISKIIFILKVTSRVIHIFQTSKKLHMQQVQIKNDRDMNNNR